MIEIRIDDAPLTLHTLRQAWLKPVTVSISDLARDKIEHSARKIAEVLDGGDSVYGVNTGFGLLANVRVSDDELVHETDLGCLLGEEGPAREQQFGRAAGADQERTDGSPRKSTRGRLGA